MQLSANDLVVIGGALIYSLTQVKLGQLEASDEDVKTAMDVLMRVKWEHDRQILEQGE